MAGSMSETKLAPETHRRACADFGADPAPERWCRRLHAASTYARDDTYRLRDPARELLPQRLPTRGAGGGGDRGARGSGRGPLLFASGMAAITTLFETVPQGAHVVAPEVMYYGTRRLAAAARSQGADRAHAVRSRRSRCGRPGGGQGAHRHSVDRDADQPDIGTSSTSKRRRQIAHGANAILAVDATATSRGDDAAADAGRGYRLPFGDEISERPLATCWRARSPAAPSTDRWQAIAAHRTKMGNVLAFHRGLDADPRLRTLHIRVRKSCDNALAVAQHLARHPAVERVLYPGLAGPSRP